MSLQIAPAGPDDAGELLTVQRAAFVSEAQLYDDPRLPPSPRRWTSCGPRWTGWC